MRAYIGAIQLTLVLSLVFIFFYANATEQSCTPWRVKDSSSHCLLSGGVEGLYYIRDCTNIDRICRWKPSGPMNDCDKTMLCTQDNPNTIIDCGPWRKVPGVNCINRETGHSEPKWSRSCVIGGMIETHCSRQPPPGAFD